MEYLPRPEDLPPDVDLPRPISVTFIPATVFDNPALLQVNPNYFAWLLSLPQLERERLLGANWKIRPAGLYFKREWCAVVDEVPAEPRHRPLLGSRRHRKDRVQRPRLDCRHQARAGSERRLLAARYGARVGQPGRRRPVAAQYRNAERQTGPHRVRRRSGAGPQEPGASPGARAQRLRSRPPHRVATSSRGSGRSARSGASAMSRSGEAPGTRTCSAFSKASPLSLMTTRSMPAAEPWKCLIRK
jgi:hypothetical protein